MVGLELHSFISELMRRTSVDMSRLPTGSEVLHHLPFFFDGLALVRRLNARSILVLTTCPVNRIATSINVNKHKYKPPWFNKGHHGFYNPLAKLSHCVILYEGPECDQLLQTVSYSVLYSIIRKSSMIILYCRYVLKFRHRGI